MREVMKLENFPQDGEWKEEVDRIEGLEIEGNWMDDLYLVKGRPYFAFQAFIFHGPLVSEKVTRG